jgi:hypothetical protein
MRQRTLTLQVAARLRAEIQEWAKLRLRADFGRTKGVCFTRDHCSLVDVCRL